jgi:hypothetical protein
MILTGVFYFITTTIAAGLFLAPESMEENDCRKNEVLIPGNQCNLTMMQGQSIYFDDTWTLSNSYLAYTQRIYPQPGPQVISHL